MAVLTPSPKTAFVDAAGEPLVGGQLYTYIAGTTTLQATYTDSTAATANTNPIILDSRGEANVWLGGAIYKFVLKDADGALIWTVDNISAPTAAVSPVLSGNVTIDSNTSSPALTITQTGTGAAFKVQDSADPDVTPFIVDSTGQVGIGTATPVSALEIASPGVFTGAWAYMPSGTRALFYQSVAPTGWTQYTGINDRALRVVSGTGGGTGGTTVYSTYFNGSFTVGSTAISTAQMPSHTHTLTDPGHTHALPGGGTSATGGAQPTGSGTIAAYPATTSSTTGITIANTGSGSGHDHTIPSLQYADVIICTKN
jgi:hypothetical protein